MPADVLDPGGRRVQADGNGESDDADDGRPESPTSEEAELEREIRSIELDIAIMDLTREVERQEQLVAEWGDGLRAAKDDVLPHEWTDEDRREDREFRAGLKEACERVAEMRARLTRLEASRPPRDTEPPA
mmetsp:Transcript_57593/g.166710  ORF Transcript_57593/g.166710 Transcript_57593/m.166710 type:complete len:131 (+) Transcript_57593:63-455(+)